MYKQLVVGLELLLGLLLGVTLGPLLVDVVKTLGLDCAVYNGTGETSEDLLCPFVRFGFAVLFLMLLVCLGGLIGGGASEEFMADLSLVWGLIDLVVGIGLGAVVAEPSHDDKVLDVVVRWSG